MIRIGRPPLQRGKGIASIFRFFSNLLFPLFKKSVPIVKAVLKNKSVKKGIRKLKKQATKTAVNSTIDLVKGKSPKHRIQKDMAKVKSILEETMSNSSKPHKRKKFSKSGTFKKHKVSIFND